MLWTLILVLHALVAIGLIVTVVMQSSKSAGLSGTIAGGAEQVFGKKKGMDEVLNRISSILAVLFILTALILIFIQPG